MNTKLKTRKKKNPLQHLIDRQQTPQSKAIMESLIKVVTTGKSK